MKLKFYKYQALGNDFVIIDYRKLKSPQITKDQIQKICNRTTGIGCDQLMVLVPHPKNSVKVKIYNQDGSTAKMCGNGVRAVAHFLKLQNSSILTDSGMVECHKLEHDIVSAEITIKNIKKINKKNYLINVGNQHKVHIVKNLSKIEKPKQLNKYNYEFVKILGNQYVSRVFERGVGETKACGSGAIAIAIAASQNQTGIYEVKFSGGTAFVVIDNHSQKARLISKVEFVFSGEIEI